MEMQALQREFYDALLSITSSDDKAKPLIFDKLRNYLSNYIEINLRFQSFELSMKEISSKIINNSNLSTINHLSNKSSIEKSSSNYSNQNINKYSNIGKDWKFATIIRTRFEMSLLASNSHMIMCYNNHNNFLHFILITGQFQGNVKWKYAPIIDILW